MPRALTTSLALALCAALANAVAAQRPNILFVYLDDFGWRDTGYMGSDFYETPNIDELARSGLVFTDAYSCAANCAPARACLLSGQYTPRHQVFNVGTRPRGKAAHRRLDHVAGTATLRPDIVTWAEALQASGYATGMFGKWHLGTTPTAQGFDVAVDHKKLPGFKGHRGPNGSYLADVLTDKAIEFIQGQDGKPWCTYLAHFAVHTPLQPKQELLPKYQQKQPGELHSNAIMATMIQAVDDGVGRIMELLRATGQDENTVILFYSDNGGYGPATDMDPLWGYKGNYYEGGIRVPFFVHWPGVVTPGKSAEPIIGVDIYPTLLELAGAAQPKDQALDGVSLVSLCKGRTTSLGERALFWHFPAYLQSYQVIHEQRDPLFRTRPVSVIRRGDFKLHENLEDGTIELYDLSSDIRERSNLVDSHPAERDALLSELQTWRRTINAPIPVKSSTFDKAAHDRATEKRMKRSQRR